MDILEIGEMVRKARRRAGLTQAEVAQLSGVSRVRLLHLETGTAMDMQLSTVLRILKAVGLEMRIGPDGARRPILEELVERKEDLYDAPGLG